MAGSSEKDQLLPSWEWLVDMLEKPNQQTSSSKPEIGKVPRTLREIKSNENCFDPSVVALGPYHHDEERLKPMESYKKEAACWFVKLLGCPSSANNVSSSCRKSESISSKVREIYGKFVTEATTISPKEPVATANNNQTQNSVNSTTAKKNLKDWYVADESTEKFNDEQFNHMMFLDGCFILYFIYHVGNINANDMMITHLNRALIAMDMFKLENQIPYVVLKALMKLMDEETEKLKAEQSSNNKQKKIDIDSFILITFLLEDAPTRSCLSLVSPCLGPLIGLNKEMRDEKRDDRADGTNTEGILHLLDFLRIKLIGVPPEASHRGFQDYYFRSIMELKAAGIKIHRSHSRHLNEIKFKKGLIYSELFLPQMSIDDATKPLLLNLTAYEMCPQGPSSSDGTITSYICFMDSFIKQADDVKELRSKDVILLNSVGCSDEKVATLFNEVASNLVPNPWVYGDTMTAIQSHFRSRWRSWFAEMLYSHVNAHFSRPWTFISLIAAIFLLFLTAVQTFYTVWN